MTRNALGRMMYERPGLEEENTDYKVFFKDDNLLDFEAYIYGPEDSLYRHKLVKLRIVIPEQYPYNPPQVTFIQHSGGRVHPNLYVEGKVCLSIIGTWPRESWTAGLCVHVVLISIRSLLDNEPYRHEPDCGNNPEYNKFVQFTTWRSLLLDYVQHEDYEPCKAMLKDFVRAHSTGIMADIHREKGANKDVVRMSSPYSEWTLVPDYDRLIAELQAMINAAKE